MEDNLMKNFCKTLDTRFIDKLDYITQQLLIDASYTSLFQKYGNQNIAEIILQHFNEIKKISGSWIYTGDFNLNGYQSLKRMGVVTIPVIPLQEIPAIRKRFHQTLLKFPEYKRHPTDPTKNSAGNPLVYVLGGFAALGNPGSFHNDLVRELRIRAREAIIPLLQTLIKRYANQNLSNNTKLEVLFDRMMFRQVSQQPSQETWHRDVIPNELIGDNDEIFGGWINLDQHNQYFSCIPGSHLGVRQRDLKEGFATVPKDKINIIGKHRYSFPVPPGHIIIFPQYILHEVVSQKSKYDMMRLFTGWRTTIRNEPLHPDIEERLEKQSIIPLPGGMLPPMYASNHGSFFLWKAFRPIPRIRNFQLSTIQWSNQTMKSITEINRPEKGDKPAYNIVPRRGMLSLQEYGFPLYTEYTEAEKKLYSPQNIT